MAGEIPPKNPTENPSASAWDMEPHTEVKDAEYYRSHPGEINVFVADLIRLRGGAASIKEGATWDKVQRTHVDKDGIPRDWAHLTGYLKRNPDQIDRFLEEYKSLGGGNEGAPVEQEASAAQGGEEENKQPEPTSEQPAAPETQPKPTSEQPAAPETQPEPTSEQPSTPEATNETSETNETNEAEMTHEQLVAAVKKFLGTEVFDASDHLGIDLHDDVFSFKDLPDGDIQRILDELNRMHGEGGAAANAGGNGEGEKVTETLIDGVKLPVPTPEPIIKSNNEGNNGGTSAAEGGNGGSGDNNGGDNGGDRNNGKNGGESGAENKEEERKRTIGRRMLDFLSRNRARIITVAALTTILTTMGLFGPKQVDTLDDDRSNTAGEDYDGEHNLESMESQWIIDGYGEQGMWLSETKAGPTCFADAVEVNKALGETDNARLMVCYTAANQSESFADYMTAMPDDMRPEALRGITNIVEMEKAIETKLSKDEYMNARKTFDFYLQYAEEEDVYLDGDYENAYMKLLDEGSDVTHENMELVRCVTHEHHTHAKRIIFKDKDGNVIGEFIVKANTDLEQGKTGCMQVVRPVGSSAFEGMDPGPENPEQDPEEPEDDDDDDDDDHHDDDDHEDDDDDDGDDHEDDDDDDDDDDHDDDGPTSTTKPPKNAQAIQDNMGVDESESTNQITQMTSENNNTDHPDVPADGSADAYNTETQTFGDTAPGAGAGDSNNDSVVDQTNEQVGAQDTSLKSADGSGNTIAQNIDNAEQNSTGTDAATGETVNTADDSSRTAEDAAEQVTRVEKHEAELQTVEAQTPAQEAAEAEENAHKNDTPEEVEERQNNAAQSIDAATQPDGSVNIEDLDM